MFMCSSSFTVAKNVKDIYRKGMLNSLLSLSLEGKSKTRKMSLTEESSSMED